MSLLSKEYDASISHRSLTDCGAHDLHKPTGHIGILFRSCDTEQNFLNAHIDLITVALVAINLIYHRLRIPVAESARFPHDVAKLSQGLDCWHCNLSIETAEEIELAQS
jgi:hypothetical protein